MKHSAQIITFCGAMPAETKPRSNFPESRVAFPWYNQLGYRIFWRNRSSTRRSHTCQHLAEITQSHTFAALIRLFTTTHNLLTFNKRNIIEKIGKTQPIGRQKTPLDFSFTLVLFKFPDVETHGRRSTLALFSQSWPGSKFTCYFALT